MKFVPTRTLFGTTLPLLACALWVIIAEFRLPIGQRIVKVPPTDLLVYLRAGTAVAHHQPLYAGDFVPTLPFTYPPFAGVLFQGLAPLDELTATIVWQGINAAALLVVVWLVYRSWLPTVMLSIAVLGLDAVHGSFFFGQINIVLMMLIACDFLPRTHRWGGIGVGLAAGIKLTPAFFLLVFVIQKRWKALGVSVATFAATVLIGWWRVPDAATFWTSAIHDSSRVGVHDNPGAQSLRSILIRYFHVDSSTWWLVAVAACLIVVVLGVALAVHRTDPAWAVALAGIGSCLVSPFSWFHHWVWVVVVAAVLTRNFSRPILAQWAAVAGTIVLMLPQLSWAVSPQTAASLDPNSAWFLAMGVATVCGYVAVGGVSLLRSRSKA